MSREDLARLQLSKLRSLLDWAYGSSPLWRRKLEPAGVAPESLKTLDDIRRIPFLTREELNHGQQEKPIYGDILAVPQPVAVRYHQTSGTTGRAPLRILDGRKDWEWIAEAWCYGLWAFGVRPEDTVFLAYGYGTFIGFWGAHYAAEKIGALTIPSGGMTSEDRIKKIIELGATVLVCTPTYALRLAQVAREMGVDLARESRIRLTIHAGEPGANIPSTKKAIEEAWGARCGDFPGMSETGGSTSYECDAQCGGIHILEDHYIQEVVRPGGDEPVAMGEEGELILTSFGRATMPLIRYRTGDLVRRVEAGHCSCGRTFDLYLGGILGRADDMKLIRGTNVFPSAVENIVRGFSEIDEFQIIVFREKGIDQIALRFEPRDGIEPTRSRELVERLSDELYEAHRLRFYVEEVSPGTLARFELKAKRLKDIRHLGDLSPKEIGGWAR